LARECQQHIQDRSAAQDFAEQPNDRNVPDTVSSTAPVD
jgi:hypothetical protein